MGRRESTFSSPQQRRGWEFVMGRNIRWNRRMFGRCELAATFVDLGRELPYLYHLSNSSPDLRCGSLQPHQEHPHRTSNRRLLCTNGLAYAKKQPKNPATLVGRRRRDMKGWIDSTNYDEQACHYCHYCCLPKNSQQQKTSPTSPSAVVVSFAATNTTYKTHLNVPKSCHGKRYLLDSPFQESGSIEEWAAKPQPQSFIQSRQFPSIKLPITM
jgi:hypothetical protein